MLVILAHSVTRNNITGEAAEKLKAAVIEMPSLIDFGGIPIKLLQENSMTDLDLSNKSLGVPEALVLSNLLPGASSLVQLKCAAVAQAQWYLPS